MDNCADNILTKAKAVFPKFNFDEIGVILNLNKLAIKFIKEFRNQEVDFTIVFFDFINSYDKSGEEYLDIIEVGFLEILTDNFYSQKVALEYLKGDLLTRFDKLFDDKFWKLN